MAKIDISKFPQHLQTKLQKAVDKLTSPQAMAEIGEEIKSGIYKRTKLGFGVEESLGKQAKLKPLSDGYKKQRKTLPLDSTASPSRSNLTKSGEMLKDMKVTAKDDKTSITFGSKLSRDKVIWNADMGRTFFNVSQNQLRSVVSSIQKKLLELLK